MTEPKRTALGLIETRGLAASIEAADALVKSANVEIVTRQQPGGGRITIMVRGDTGSVQAALDAGRLAAAAVGEVLSSHIIPRPAEPVDGLLKRQAVR